MISQEMRERLAGPVSSLPVPFNQDGDIDFTGLRSIIDFVIDGGATAVILTWGDSLFSILTDDDIGQVTRAVCEHTRGRVPVVAADGIWWLGRELQFARECREMGADMLMALPPDWAQACTTDSLVDYYAAVAEEIPLMAVTNVFSSRGHSFGIDVLERLADRSEGFVAVKDDLCGPFARRLGLALHDRIAIVSGGQKQNHLDVHPYGCDSYLSTFIKFHPPVVRKYWDAIQSSDMPAAAGVVRDYDMPFFTYVLGLTGGFDAGVHGCLELAGLAERWRRKPYHSLTDQQMEDLAEFLRSLAVL